MSTRITHFWHPSSVETDQASIGTAFDVAKAHEHTLYDNSTPDRVAAINWKGMLESLIIRVKAISTATALTVRVSLDAAGDYTVMPDVAVDISTGLTTATTGCVAISIALPIKQILAGPGNSSLFVHIKTDAGTVTLDESHLVWSE
jgi:hypothetical protein